MKALDDASCTQRTRTLHARSRRSATPLNGAWGICSVRFRRLTDVFDSSPIEPELLSGRTPPIGSSTTTSSAPRTQASGE